jgi:hypothetical protein
VTRKQQNLAGENRALKQQLEAVTHARLSNGPLLRFLLAYDQLDQQSEPLQGRPYETASSPHPYDRPLPYVATMRSRDLQGRVDRALGPLADRITDFLNGDPTPGRGECLACGGRVGGRPPTARLRAVRFLQQCLDKPMREEHLLAAARQHGVSRQTLRRAADELRVARFDEEGERWWAL